MKTRITAEPFRAWLELRVAQVGARTLASQLGVHARQLYRWRFEASHVSLENIEDALHLAGVGLWEVYGESDAETARLEVELERFWRFVPHTPPEPEACWIWQGSLTGGGPQLPGSRGGPRTLGTPFFMVRGHSRTATRFIYQVMYGDPGTHLVRRRCGNLRCVRPEHLYVPALEHELVAA